MPQPLADRQGIFCFGFSATFIGPSASSRYIRACGAALHRKAPLGYHLAIACWRDFLGRVLSQVREILNPCALPALVTWRQTGSNRQLPGCFAGCSTFELCPHILERHTGFEPAPTAWKAVVLPLHQCRNSYPFPNASRQRLPGPSWGVSAMNQEEASMAFQVVLKGLRPTWLRGLNPPTWKRARIIP